MVDASLEIRQPLHPSASPISIAGLAAEERNLHHLFDAYQTFCLHGGFSLSWTNLAKLLELVTQPRTLIPGSESRPSHPHQDAFSHYLHNLHYEELGHLVSDLMIAFFHITGVLQLSDHVQKSGESPCLEVVAWETGKTNDLLAAVREHFQMLKQSQLQYMLKTVKDEMLVQAQKPHDSPPLQSWAPCSHSHPALLLQLDLDLDPFLVKVLEENLGCTRSLSSERWSFEPESRRASFLSRRLRSAQVTLSALEPIQEYEHRYSSLVPGNKGHGKNVELAGRYEGEQSIRNSKRSSFSDFGSFFTARTHETGSSTHRSFMSARTQRSALTNGTANRTSSIQSFVSWPTVGHTSDVRISNEWSRTLALNNVVSNPELEDWSQGRGQHVKYELIEVVPLSVEKQIGVGGTAVVDNVLCKQVRLVCKTIVCRRNNWKLREEVIREITQLYNAEHAHIVRLIGTYTMGLGLAILTYPCAEWNLDEFLNSPPAVFDDDQRKRVVRKFFACLANVLAFIHSCPIKHMDIKPRDILVRDVRKASINSLEEFRVYLADFGSSRFYPTIDQAVTDSAASFTRAYAASEVILERPRGLAADVFSMGCVFTEMLATVAESPENLACRSGLLEARSGSDGLVPYSSRLESICEWLTNLHIYDFQIDLLAVRRWTIAMLNDSPLSRPLAQEIAEDPQIPQSCVSCARRLPEAFERIQPATED